MDDEKIVGIIPNVSRKKGLFNSELCNLVVTNRRLIVAILSDEMQKEATQKADQEAKEHGEGRFKRFVKAAEAHYSVYQKYLSMPVEEIISETEGNFFIDASQIKSIGIEGGGPD